MFSFSFSGIICFLAFTAMAGINFLAIDVPHNRVQEVVKKYNP